MRTIETTLYHYSELTPDAQSRAIQWYRELDHCDPCYAESILTNEYEFTYQGEIA